MNGPYHYSILIRWDPRDNIYIAEVPELPGAKTHGKTYEEALEMIPEVIDLWLEVAADEGEPLPAPRTYGDYVAAGA
jgi:predicted RNase H-like HicB family nuclease